MIKMVCFDMDGTIADLYGVENWLPMLRAENPLPYRIASPMWDMDALVEVLNGLQAKGIEIRIITWLAKDASKNYDNLVREAKKEWLDNVNFNYNHFHGVKYGTTKANSVRRYLGEGEEALLIDDNKKVRNGWHLGETIDPINCNLIEKLSSLL